MPGITCSNSTFRVLGVIQQLGETGVAITTLVRANGDNMDI